MTILGIYINTLDKFRQLLIYMLDCRSKRRLRTKIKYFDIFYLFNFLYKTVFLSFTQIGSGKKYCEDFLIEIKMLKNCKN